MVTKANPLTDPARIARFQLKLRLAVEFCAEALKSGDIEYAMQQVQSAERLLKDSIEKFWQPIPEKKEVDNY